MPTRLLTAAFALAVALPALVQAADAPRVFLLDAKQLAHNRNELRSGEARLAPALDKLKQDADRALKAGPFSVMHKKIMPPSGDKHDYMSYARYWWPNPDTPDGLPYVRRDGEHNPGTRKVSDREEISGLADSVETLALAHYFTGDERYGDRAATLLRNWFIDPATRMNPSFQYAQAIPGRNTGRGYGLIDAQDLTQVVDAVGLLAGSKAWTADDDRALRQWFGAFLDWMLDTEMGRDEASAKNNHGTYYDVQVASYAFFVDRPEVARKVLAAVPAKRIAVQVEPDGRQPLELDRANGWGYSVGNLRGLMKLAKLGERVDLDLWNFQSEDGRGIRAAVEYLAPYCLDHKTWTQNKTNDFSAAAMLPILRQAAEKYPDAPFAAKLKQFPAKPTNRENLTGP